MLKCSTNKKIHLPVLLPYSLTNLTCVRSDRSSATKRIKREKKQEVNTRRRRAPVSLFSPNPGRLDPKRSAAVFPWRHVFVQLRLSASEPTHIHACGASPAGPLQFPGGGLYGVAELRDRHLAVLRKKSFEPRRRFVGLQARITLTPDLRDSA